MIITIENKSFETSQITQLYPAAIIKTGYNDETTQVSLEWLDVEAKGKVEVVGYGIFVMLQKEQKHSFIFDTKEQMDRVIAKISTELNALN